MATVADASLGWETEASGLAFARDVLRIEAEALGRVRERLDPSIARAADLIFRCAGGVIVTGMGKAGIVGQKLAATLASTGTAAFPLHPAEAVHGDLGRIRAGDVVVGIVPRHNGNGVGVRGGIGGRANGPSEPSGPRSNRNAVTPHQAIHPEHIQHGFVDAVGGEIAEAVKPTLAFEFE